MDIASASHSDQAARAAIRRDWVSRAMEAMRARQFDAAWLWADRLFRTCAGAARADALLLRSTVFAMQGDRAAAQADLDAALDIDPHAPPINRILLRAPDRQTRQSAARRLLASGAPGDRDKAFAALSRDGLRCVGVLEAADNRLVARLTWKGGPDIRLTLRSEQGERAITARAGLAPPPGFDRAARVICELPPGVAAAALTPPGVDALFEPEVLLFDRRDIAARPGATSLADRKGLLIVVPVHGDREATALCLESLFAAAPAGRQSRIIVVEDAAPDIALVADLEALAASGRIELLRNSFNIGFAASVNRALARREPEEDALILNADTVVPPGAIAGLACHLAAHRDIGTVTPLSNNGEDVSFPVRFRANPLPRPPDVKSLHAVAARVNRGRAVDMPNGIGFCLYVRGETLDRAGPFPVAFGRGYYEDVAFCMEAARAGYRNVCATDVYVGHAGGRSFGGEKRALVARNLRRLEATYPGYFARARAFEQSDPLREFIGRIERERLRKASGIDLLALPAEAPPPLARAIAAALRRDHPSLLIARIDRTASSLHLTLRGVDGDGPQNLEWTFDASTALADELSARLSELPLGKAYVLEAGRTMSDVVRALARLRCEIRKFSASSLTFRLDPGMAVRSGRDRAIRTGRAVHTDEQSGKRTRPPSTELVLTLPSLPDFQAPRLRSSNGLLAIAGLAARDEDLLRAVLALLPMANGGPRVALADGWNGSAAMARREDLYVGAVAEAELPQWLARAGARAIFFADRQWGRFDPRFSLWREMNLAVASFGGRGESHAPPGCLSLPPAAPPATQAASIANWLAAQT